MNGLEGKLRSAGVEDAILRCLEHGPVGTSRPKEDVTRLIVTPFAGSTAFPSYVVQVHWAGGEELKLFLKTFGTSRLPKEDLAGRRDRELTVYRDLLPSERLGTARFFGHDWDGEDPRYWLLLEFVKGVELRSVGFDYWLRAARWVGQLQGAFANSPSQRLPPAALVRHDSDFFESMARDALSAVEGVSEPLHHRLAAVLEDYDRIVGIMTEQPPSLVHGSFRPQNILVDPSSHRVCPVDWELAAWGSPILDLAFLCDGFRHPRLQLLWEAYAAGLKDQGEAPADPAHLPLIVDCFRLHKQVKSLSDATRLKFSAQVVEKLVGLAEEMWIACRNGAGG